MELVLDVETSFQTMVSYNEDGKKRTRTDPRPYNPFNVLVSVGYMDALDHNDVVEYLFFNHSEIHKQKHITIDEARTKLQKALDAASVLVVHHGKFDVSWLYECGYTYEGMAWDTAIAEYILARGQRINTSLLESTIRRKCGHKKLDITKAYINDGVSFEDIPYDIVEEYGKGDILSTRDLYREQVRLFSLPENEGLLPTLRMMNEFMFVLVEMERNGVPISMGALDEVEADLRTELLEMNAVVDKAIPKLMGDTPINMRSPEDRSKLVFSREVIDKKVWADTFSIGTEMRGGVAKPKYQPRMAAKVFVKHVLKGTNIIFKTKAHQCRVCHGDTVVPQELNGKITKRKVRCPGCRGKDGKPTGIQYVNTKEVAGLKIGAASIADTSAVGFKTNGDLIERVTRLAKDHEGVEFLSALSRINSLSSYLSSYVGGIKRFCMNNGILHTNLNQTIAATGRLSSSEPNFQNMPRGNTFPVRKAVVSRWADEGGEIMEADYGQLEFRSAAFQAQDEVAIKEIKEGFDVHSFTAKTLTEAGEPKDRQDAKADTFKPLYGGTSGTPAQMAYYKAFAKKYTGIGEWHGRLQDEAISTKRVVISSGREYAFPGASRTKYGGSTFATQIKNYPVQGFATGDVVPLACIRLYKAFKRKGVKSLMFLTVHDSIVVDVYPGEKELVRDILTYEMLDVIDELKTRYDVEFNVPLSVEIKSGPSWLGGKVIMEAEHNGFGKGYGEFKCPN